MEIEGCAIVARGEEKIQRMERSGVERIGTMLCSPLPQAGEGPGVREFVKAAPLAIPLKAVL